MHTTNVSYTGGKFTALLAIFLSTCLPITQVFADPPASRTAPPASPAKAAGSLTVKIKPIEAKQDRARWRVDGGKWQKSNRTVSGIEEGQHTVSFKTIAGWTKPNNKNVNIIANQESKATGTYVRMAGAAQTILLPGDLPLVMIWIPPGSFTMGRYTGEQDSYSDEDPSHEVAFANGFWIGKYEVTQAQWVALMGTNPSLYTGDLNRPVERVSWDTVQSFISALNTHIGNTGQGAATFKLPSESQWEYACRAGTTTRYYWGDDPDYTSIDNCAWYYVNSGSTTHPVGQKLPNPWGLYDMSGNVSEWCEDWYHSSYTGAPANGSAWVSPIGQDRVERGGKWFVYGNACRSADRSSTLPGDSSVDHLGFRLAR